MRRLLRERSSRRSVLRIGLTALVEAWVAVLTAITGAYTRARWSR